MMNLFRRRRIAVPVGRFDVDTDRWRDVDDGGSAQREQLTVATFNIWFNELHREQRYRAIASLLSRELPDIMVFQEVTGTALEVFLAQPWIREHYCRAAVAGDGSYGMLMLSRLPIRRSTYTRLPTHLSRGYLTAELSVNGVDLRIVSVHLESGKKARQLRARQLSRLFRAFRGDGNVVLLGDFNLRDDENHELDPQYQDVWPSLRPDEPGIHRGHLDQSHALRHEEQAPPRQVRPGAGQRPGVEGRRHRATRTRADRPVAAEDLPVGPLRRAVPALLESRALTDRHGRCARRTRTVAATTTSAAAPAVADTTTLSRCAAPIVIATNAHTAPAR